jgi:tetratricopeptide (TPR) repeat protein
MIDPAKLSATGRRAMAARDWNTVGLCGIELKRAAPGNAEGPFFLGVAQKAAGQPQLASQYFAEALQLDQKRYDAAIELAFQDVLLNRHAEARELVDRYRSQLGNSPLYLDLAGQTYMRMSLYQDARDLFEKALELQPGVEAFLANLAACVVYLGDIETAGSIYRKLLRKHPRHQRYHYELAQLKRATDDEHVRQMEAALRKTAAEPARNIFLYYALGKELEDLERWDESFDYYRKGGDAARSTMNYKVEADIDVMNTVIETCSADWLQRDAAAEPTHPAPVFVVGLPRTGTTLTDRILSSHSSVDSAGETQLLQMVLRQLGGAAFGAEPTPSLIRQAAGQPAASVAEGYLQAIAYRLGEAPWFIDKLPENVLYLGFVAKAWPNAKMVHLRRNPMDACFAMYKQSYFRFAYSLDDLARYYLAYDRLSRHWREVLGERLVEVEYERLVADQENETRQLLERLDLPFEEACLHFERNVAPVATASSVQVREKVHTRSVGKWKKYEQHLEPLKEALVAGGVAV